EGGGARAGRARGRGRRAGLRARGHLLTVQALGGGSLELPALGPAPGGRPTIVTEEKRKKEGKGGTLRGCPLPTDPVELPIEDSLDLHSFRPQDVRSVVAAYLTAAHAPGSTEARLNHGRGNRVH